MNTNSLIEAVKEKLGLPSDYALAKFLNIDSTSIGDMRRRGLSDERVLQFAEILEINPGEALAAMRAERAKNPEVKAAWKKVAESMRSALGVFTPALIAVAIVASSSEPAKAAMLSPAADNPGHCILCKIIKWLFYSLFRSLSRWFLPPLFALALSACGQDAGAPHETAVTTVVNETLVQCDYRGPTGICVAFADAKAADIPAADYERAYRFVEHCMYDNYAVPGAPGPVVRVLSEMFPVDGKPVAGYTDFSTGLIRAVGFGTVYHEYVHYLLLRAGFPNDANANHEHSAFTTCGARAGLLDA